jgi:diguanylate cyclase (GGDEF)-like protein
MSETHIPQSLVDGLLALCQGDFSFRMKRTMKRDAEDTVAFFVNAIAEELERIFQSSRDQEAKLSRAIEDLSKALTRVAAGDFTVQVPRDFSGDSADVLARLVNSTVAELGTVVESNTRRALDDRRQLEQLVEERTRELKLLATTDPLTGTLNRRRFFEVAEEERLRSARYGHRLVVGMLDLDHFKLINDMYGHAVGDEAIRRVAEALRRALRRQDHIGRYGGEEFGVLLPETRIEEAVKVFERVRQGISDLEVRTARMENPKLRVSIGVTEWMAGEGFEMTLQRADDALYKAKDAGRDRVVAVPVTS